MAQVGCVHIILKDNPGKGLGLGKKSLEKRGMEGAGFPFSFPVTGILFSRQECNIFNVPLVPR